ncbi:molybdopterin-dependent oxidoreductase [Bacillus alkalicellulosilyticus]|uniref:molybdopterin-dependent oxidoreductase n=1 Tax=Alkalihalobacterium alkalicellulosilyticum TaxID=1912214 RepID=UPI000997AEA1|nr:molybdopterin-dependent oxidoreductase [Bacillus alkalicellulosilyticus]
MESYIQQESGVFPSVCSLDCPDQCGLLIHKKNGKIVKIEGDPVHPVTQGHICNKVRHMPDRIYDKKRLKYPMKRIGKKGEGKFERISWSEAIEVITSKWKKLIKDYGAETILPYSFYGNMGRLSAEGIDRRFFHTLGASRLDQTICSAAGSVGYSYTMGGSLGTDPEQTVHSKLIIFWGINAVSTNMHQVALAQKARKNGAKIVVIDVHKNQTGRLADWFIPIEPGTDAALALGIMNILFEENMADESFLELHTIGHKELQEHVRQYDPHTVSSITGVSVSDLYELARLYGTTNPSFIRIGNGLQHHDNGGMAVRTIACLPAITGQWNQRGGGAIKGNGSYLRHNVEALRRPDLLKEPTRMINMNLLGQALVDMNPPIHSLFVYNSNPALVTPDGNKVREGLARKDLFTVVHDLFLTETAMYADVVLPATSSFENTDFFTSYWHHYIHYHVPVIHPYEESKSNSDVFRLLAASFNFNDPVLHDSDDELINQAFTETNNKYIEHITLNDLRSEKYIKAKDTENFLQSLPTASGKIELYSSTMEQLGLPPLPTYMPLKKEEEEGGDFWFIPAPNHNFLNSTFSNNNKHITLEKNPKLFMNHKDADRLGIENGEKVKISNHRGECMIMASVGDSVLPGVVVSQGLWADKDGENYFVNALTPDRLSDMGGGATFFSGRVNINKVDL